MDMFKDYNTYKQYQPQYAKWKEARDKQEAKRLAYLEKHPELIKEEDIERGKTILQAIDILDEYSQAKAENTEITTKVISQEILTWLSFAGGAAGFAVMRKIKPLQQHLDKMFKKSGPTVPIIMASLTPMLIGGAIASIAAFPLMAWAAKTETGASRRGRLDAMRTKLQNPAFFATLTTEQKKKLTEETATIKLSKDEEKLSTPQFSFREAVNTLKNINKQAAIERQEQEEFEKIIYNSTDSQSELIGEALEKSKRDQQILTKLVEKIDIASQDYAENVELATQSFAILSPLIGAGIGWLSAKVNNILKLGQNTKAAKIAPWAIGLSSTLSLAIMATSIQKQASRVGRFNVKQELLKNPEQLVYIDDEKVNQEIDNNITLTRKKRPNIFKFLWQAYKDNRAYEKYQKTEGLEDKKRIKALEKLNFSEEQLAEARVLQINTFKTFNKVDTMSQKYAENVEALGEALKQPLGLILSSIGMLVGLKHLTKIPEMGSKADLNKFDKMMQGVFKYVSSVLISFVPLIAFDFYVTKQQKEATRVANMFALKELEDINNYRGYTTEIKKTTSEKV